MSATAVAATPVNRISGCLDLVGALSNVDGSNGNSFTNNGTQLVIVDNGDSGSHTITVAFASTVTGPDGTTATPRAVTVAAGKIAVLGPYPVGQYGTTVTMTWDAGTSMKVGILSPIQLSSAS